MENERKMMQKRFDIENQQIILHTYGAICSTSGELLNSPVFAHVVSLYCKTLQKQDSPLWTLFADFFEQEREQKIISLLIQLADISLPQMAEEHPALQPLLEKSRRLRLHEFVEGLYDFWRSFDRFMVLHSEPGKSRLERRPYRSFNATVETLTHIVRGTYRDICENITGDHPRIYRQVSAGCDVGLIAVPRPTLLPDKYAALLSPIPFIRQAWIAPPMIIDPPMNKRTGEFRKVDKNPLDGLTLEPEKWLCYPAQVGPLVIFVYFHQHMIDLGCALSNLFELATDEQIKAGPEAIYLFGAAPDAMKQFGELPTVFHEDTANNLLIAAVPCESRFGYFGYLKKMILTLHNIAMMKKGRMPYHGAMVRITLKNGKSANIVLIGDTATGKSESLEAFRQIGKDMIRELRIVADDMGSFDITADGLIQGYGTEIGAFVRLDDLQAGYAFEQIDRAIIMSPQKTNARVVLPVTTLDEILRGYPVDTILYANNYEQVDQDHPILERFDSPQNALQIFREGASMSKGTTTSSGLVHNYFANIFGPPQYKDLHNCLAEKVFQKAFEKGLFVGQLRTRLGIDGFESLGPQEAAKALFEQISNG
jgi:hypothetical protein